MMKNPFKEFPDIDDEYYCLQDNIQIWRKKWEPQILAVIEGHNTMLKENAELISDNLELKKKIEALDAWLGKIPSVPIPVGESRSILEYINQRDEWKIEGLIILKGRDALPKIEVGGIHRHPWKPFRLLDPVELCIGESEASLIARMSERDLKRWSKFQEEYRE